MTRLRAGSPRQYDVTACNSHSACMPKACIKEFSSPPRLSKPGGVRSGEILKRSQILGTYSSHHRGLPGIPRSTFCPGPSSSLFLSSTRPCRPRLLRFVGTRRHTLTTLLPSLQSWCVQGAGHSRPRRCGHAARPTGQGWVPQAEAPAAGHGVLSGTVFWVY